MSVLCLVDEKRLGISRFLHTHAKGEEMIFEISESYLPIVFDVFIVIMKFTPDSRAQMEY